MKILAIGAHTDDVELGCGLAIARHVEMGDEVMVFTLSACEETNRGFSLRGEMDESMAVLGVHSHVCDTFEVREFARDRQAILDRIIYWRDAFKPHAVYCPSTNDIHQDHSVVATECNRAFHRYLGEDGAFEQWAFHFRWNVQGIKPLMKLRARDPYMSTKLRALNCYKSQQGRFRDVLYSYDEYYSLVRGVL